MPESRTGPLSPPVPDPVGTAAGSLPAAADGGTGTSAVGLPAAGSGGTGSAADGGTRTGPDVPHRVGLLTTLLLGSLTALAPLSMDMYLPALPQVAESLQTSASRAQLTLTACLAGIALGQLVIGPLSDALGRRRPLLVCLVVFVLATAACTLAPGTAVLVAFRLVQGLAGSAGIVIARAVVRDMYSGLAMARFFSTLMLVSGVAPVAAPLAGGQLLRVTDWRGVFVALTGIGLVITVCAALWLKETLPPARRHSGGFRETLRTMRGLLRDRRFIGYVLTGGFACAALFAYIAGSPFVVQDVYGASPQTFSVLFGINSIGLVALGQVNGKILVGRVSLNRVLGIGLAAGLLSTTVLTALVCGVFGKAGLVPVAVTLFVLIASLGITLPNTNALALNRAAHAAGSASALLGTFPFLLGAVVSPLVGLRGEHSAVPMAVVMLGSGAVAAVLFVALCRPWRREPGSIL